MASPAGLPRRICSRIAERVQRSCQVVRGLYQDSPVVFALVLTVVFLLVLIGSVFSIVVSQYVGSRGAVIVDLSVVWLFARLVARVLLFPGSMKLFQRNTEATFRSEMARQYAHFLRQLRTFLLYATREPGTAALRGVSADGVARGCAVIETLTSSFRIQQQQHEVLLSKEQAQMQSLAQDVERWLKAAQVRRPASDPGHQGAPLPLNDWLRQVVGGCVEGSGMRFQTPMQMLMSVELAGDLEEASAGIDKIDQLLVMLDDLRHSAKSLLSTVTRFMRVPAVGSLNQLRTELQMRYGGQRCWVRRGRQKIDCMFLPCSGASSQGQGAAGDAAQEEVLHENDPLNRGSSTRSPMFSGPTIIWCNPNAAYYETMVYQANWLNFWLSHGCNLFFFNYSGYGSSTGLPSPAGIAEDGDAIVAFLKGKGITQIGVYGRSIGGVTACHLARKHPDVVQLLIADRTMSQLQTAAKYLYGAWAAKGLQLTRMIHNNVDNFWEVRCYKLLVVDPKDTMILDLAALRTAVALRVVEKMNPEERLAIDDEQLLGLADVWHFFQTLFAICEGEDEGLDNSMGGHEPLAGGRREARQPALLREDPRSSAGSVESQPCTVGAASARERVNVQWLQDNGSLVRSTMAMLVDQLRSTLDIVGEHIEGGGTSLNDVFLDSPSDPCWALRCTLANIQVWGALGNQRMDDEQFGDPHPPASSGADTAAKLDQDIELFLRKDFGHELLPQAEASPQRLAEIARKLSPETLLSYHRRLARVRVAQVRKELRRRLSALQPAFGNGAAAAAASGGSDHDVAEAERLLNTVQALLSEVESFVSALSRFFKSVDLALPYSRQQQNGDGRPTKDPPGSDSSDEKLLDASAAQKLSNLTPQPVIDHTIAGHIMHIDCGHNGVMDEVDLRQLALHLSAARFGRTPGNE